MICDSGVHGIPVDPPGANQRVQGITGDPKGTLCNFGPTGTAQNWDPIEFECNALLESRNHCGLMIERLNNKN